MWCGVMDPRIDPDLKIEANPPGTPIDAPPAMRPDSPAAPTTSRPDPGIPEKRGTPPPLLGGLRDQPLRTKIVIRKCRVGWESKIERNDLMDYLEGWNYSWRITRRGALRAARRKERSMHRDIESEFREVD